MTNINYPARQQGTTIRRRLYYDSYDEVRSVIDRLRQLDAFEHQSRPEADERGTYVVISYRDPDVVAAYDRPSPQRVPARRSRQVVSPHASVAKPLHRRQWFAPVVALTAMMLLCGLAYWALQQLAQLSAPNIGVGLLGFAFVVVLVVWAVRSLRGAGRGSGGRGGHGFHWTPCD